MFDQIDVAYYRRLAREERDKATRAVGRLAERCRQRALHYEAKACALAAPPS
ncbi:hypothetical protein [Novosphingobium guangzhouense]|uniref:hypothetical protein n=1 Tax=Novosphingobium guangzhouense TaxID=1850347 RepID=UPI001472B577|nr:hypothetical protein [Novosphingobium guangzhouense]